jgi:hypothetical protein
LSIAPAGRLPAKEAIDMLETYTKEGLIQLVGHEVVDLNGTSLGYVDLIFVDDATGRPEWIGLWGGVPGSTHTLVPVRGIELRDDELRLPWPEDIVRNAPSYSEEDKSGLLTDESGTVSISPEKERAVYEHYGLEPPAAGGEGVVRIRALTAEE